jgi:hypothetical protein
MTCSNSIAGRVDQEASGGGSFLTFDDVQERLVETIRLWWRMPGGGRWPFASDGPWHLVRAELYGPDVDRDAPLRPLPLRRAEVTEMEEATEWLTLIPDADRRVVVLGLIYLAKGRKQIPWSRMLKPMGLRHGAHGLRKRYDRALSALAFRLNGEEALG